MLKPIRAVYEKGVLRLLENIDLKDGEEVEVIIVKSSHKLAEVVKKISSEYSDVK